MIILLLILIVSTVFGGDGDMLKEFNCGKGDSHRSTVVPSVSVVVCWREGAMLTARALRELLEHDDEFVFEVIYVHVDLALWKGVLGDACALQERFGAHKLRIVTSREHVFPEKFDMYRHGAAFARSTFVLFSDNNSLGFDDKEVAQIVAAMKSTRPTPALLTNEVHAIVGGKPINHNHAKRVYFHDSPFGKALRWVDFEGRRDNSEHKMHTVFANDGGFDVLGSDLVEPHTFLVDSRVTNLTALFDTQSSRIDIIVGINAWRVAGRQSAVVNNITTWYLYPEEFLPLLDVPVVIARWAVYESITSVRYLEKRWGTLYRHQCGQSWHTAKAFDNKRFLRADWPELDRPSVAVIVSTMWLYVLHVTHVTCRIEWSDGTKSVLEDKPASELIMSLSELTDDIDKGRIVAIDAFASQRHAPVPELQSGQAGDGRWLADHVEVRKIPKPRHIFAFSDANHCIFRPVLARMSLHGAEPSDAALRAVVDAALQASFLVQRSGDERFAYFAVRGTSVGAIEKTIEQLDRRLADARIGGIERVRVKLPPPVFGKWSYFNDTGSMGVPPAIDEHDAIPILRGGKSRLEVESIGFGTLSQPEVGFRDFIEEWYLKIAMEESKLRV
jgi:hypothetical protein